MKIITDLCKPTFIVFCVDYEWIRYSSKEPNTLTFSFLLRNPY